MKYIIYFYILLEVLLFIILTIIVVDYIFNVINLLNTSNIHWDTILAIKDSSNIGTAKGTIEVDKVKIDGIEKSIDNVRDAGIYISGIYAGAKIV